LVNYQLKKAVWPLLEEIMVKEVNWKKVQFVMNAMKTQDTFLNQKNKNQLMKLSPETVIKRLQRVWFLKFLKVQMAQKLQREDQGKIGDSEVQEHLQTVFKESLHLIMNRRILLHLESLMSLILQRIISTLKMKSKRLKKSMNKNKLILNYNKWLNLRRKSLLKLLDPVDQEQVMLKWD